LAVGPAIAVAVLVAEALEPILVGVGIALIPIWNRVVIRVLVVKVGDSVSVRVSGVGGIVSYLDEIIDPIPIVVEIPPVRRAVVVSVEVRFLCVRDTVAVGIIVEVVCDPVRVGVDRSLGARSIVSRLTIVGPAVIVAVEVEPIRSAVTVRIYCLVAFSDIGDAVAISVNETSLRTGSRNAIAGICVSGGVIGMIVRATRREQCENQTPESQFHRAHRLLENNRL